jgi:hypothetical protein
MIAVNNGGTFTYAGGTLNTAGVQLTGNSSITLAPGQNKTLKTSVLSIGSASKLDVKDNKLVVVGGTVGTASGGTYSGLTGLIQRAYNFSSWDGSGITTTMPAAGPLSGLTTLAISTADATFYAGGTFGGVPVASGDVLIMYTYTGDVNLDGHVDASDYGIIDNYFQFPGASGYANGDFNFDGVIDAGDYGLIDNAYQLQGAPIPINSAAFAVTPVPEPAGMALLVAPLMCLVRRRAPHREK